MLQHTHSYVNVDHIKHLFLVCHIFKTAQRRRKRAQGGSENVKRKSAKAGCSSARRAGGSRSKKKHVEAVTLFEVVTMGKSAMQVR